MAIRNYLPDKNEVETFEEADDFEVDDEDPLPFSKYEMTPMEEDAEFSETKEPDIEAQKQEEKTETAPTEALKEGAESEKPSS